MSLPTPACPTCRADLELRADGELDAWHCPEGHGLAFTLSEAYARLAEHDIHEIWDGARSAPRSERGCPLCMATMVTVPCEAITLDVCVTDEVLWFDREVLDAMPDPVEPAPSPEEQDELAAVTRQFGDALTAGWEAEERNSLTGKLTDLLVGTPRRAPAR
jgi:Zn-finger nucleic acid-binding protein